MLLGLAAVVLALVGPLPHAILAGPSVGDVIGVLIGAVGVGVVLDGVPRWLSQGGGLRSRWRLAVVAVFVVVQWLVWPAINAGLATNAPRPVVPRGVGPRACGEHAMSASWRGMACACPAGGFRAPSTATVVVLHGSHGTRMDVIPYLRMLHDAGYGVLAYDARGHGRSSGQTNALGWKGGR